MGASSGAVSAGYRNGVGSGADSAGYGTGAGSGADSAGYRKGAGSGADSAGSWTGAGSGADSRTGAARVELVVLFLLNLRFSVGVRGPGLVGKSLRKGSE